MTADERPPACICEHERRRPPDLWGRLHHQSIMVRLAGAPAVSGTLVAFTPYEIVIKTGAGREMMIPKHSILSVDLPSGWRRTTGPEAEEKTP